MKKEMIVTLEGNKKYYLAEETIQNNIKYYLANELNEIENQTDKSVILEEIKTENDYYLDLVTDEKNLKFLSAIFISNFISEIEEI